MTFFRISTILFILGKHPNLSLNIWQPKFQIISFEMEMRETQDVYFLKTRCLATATKKLVSDLIDLKQIPSL